MNSITFSVLLNAHKFVFSLVLLLMACSSPVQQDIQERDNKAKKVLLISFDGFRADYLNAERTPYLHTLAQKGAKSEGLIPVFPSKTFPNHYAIAVGLHPENNGLIGNSIYDSTLAQMYRIGDREQVERADWYEGEPIWNTAEKQGVRAGTMFWVGSEAPVQGIRPTHWKRYDGSVPDSARIDTVIHWLGMGTDLEVDLATLYFSFLDSQGHRYGTDAPETDAALLRVDGLMKYLMEELESAGLTKQTNVVLVSDHGMQNISRDRVITLDSYMDLEKVLMIGGSPVATMNIEAVYRAEVYNTLKNAQEEGAPFQVFLKEELPERLHNRKHPRTPDLTIIADLGYSLTTTQQLSSNPNYPSGGNHGYDPQHAEMHAVFVAIGPDFAPNSHLEAFESIHVYSLLAHLLGLNPAPNDGDLMTFEGILSE